MLVLGTTNVQPVHKRHICYSSGEILFLIGSTFQPNLRIGWTKSLSSPHPHDFSARAVELNLESLEMARDVRVVPMVGEQH